MLNLIQPTYFILYLYFLLILTNAKNELEIKKKEQQEITAELEEKDATKDEECGMCPTYFQKICAFDFSKKSTFIFDNECIMKLYNCKHKTAFVRVNYERCLFFGNFAYVHGLNNDDYDYGDHVTVKYVKKNPDFVK